MLSRPLLQCPSTALALLVGFLQCVIAACTPIPSFTVAFPVDGLDIHGPPRPSSLAVSMHCAECGCACSESADPTTADVIVHTERIFRGRPSYSDEDLAKIAAYNPTGLRVIVSMESTYWRPNTRNATVLQHFDAVASYERAAQLPLLYGPVPTEVPAFGYNAPYLPPHTWSSAGAHTQASVVERPKGIALFMSYCVPWRLRLVQELQRYVDIDTFGRCFPGRPHTNPFQSGGNTKLTSMTEYKMFFALENAICTDYATEKLYAPLLHGAVPIYLGAPNMAELIPDEDAVINLLDFGDAQAAAAYLKIMLDDSRALYKKHHAWRGRQYTGAFAERLAHSHKGRNFICSLCSLYRDQKKAGRYTRLGAGERRRAQMHAAPMHECTEMMNGTWPFY